MSTQKFDFAGVTPELVAQVREVVAETGRKTFSVSRVYGAYNAAYGKADKPETCPSCLATRANELRIWLGFFDAQNATPDYEAGADVQVINLADNVQLHFTSTGEDKGTVTYADGQTVKAGTYETTEAGKTISVQPGGKATLKTATTEKPATGRKAVAEAAKPATGRKAVAEAAKPAIEPATVETATTEAAPALEGAPAEGEPSAPDALTGNEESLL